MGFRTIRGARPPCQSWEEQAPDQQHSEAQRRRAESCASLTEKKLDKAENSVPGRALVPHTTELASSTVRPLRPRAQLQAARHGPVCKGVVSPWASSQKAAHCEITTMQGERRVAAAGRRRHHHRPVVEPERSPFHRQCIREECPHLATICSVRLAVCFATCTSVRNA